MLKTALESPLKQQQQQQQQNENKESTPISIL